MPTQMKRRQLKFSWCSFDSNNEHNDFDSKKAFEVQKMKEAHWSMAELLKHFEFIEDQLENKRQEK